LPVHDPARVAKVERLEQLEDVVPHVKVGESWVENLEVDVVDVFKDDGRRLRLRDESSGAGQLGEASLQAERVVALSSPVDP
jgi:hypothetical protein